MTKVTLLGDQRVKSGFRLMGCHIVRLVFQFTGSTSISSSVCLSACLSVSVFLSCLEFWMGEKSRVHWELTKVDDIAVHGPPTECL